MRTALRASACLLTALALGLPLTAATAGPSSAATRAMPGDFTGFAFDTCDAPSQRHMDAWRLHSKYAGVGIYIAGMNRACKSQRHLTGDWVRTQARRGWRLLPLVVGRQAACAPKGYYQDARISPDPAGDYAKASRQGRRAGTAGGRAARGLGIGKGSVLWFDLEYFDISKDRCRRSALHFVSSWTRRLHGLGYRSGFYSSASSGIAAVEYARRTAPGDFALPDYLWFAQWNGRRTLHTEYLGKHAWWPHRRVHQFRGDHRERHGGVGIHIDSDFLSSGKGTLAGPKRPHCGDTRVSFGDYPRLARGDSGSRVRAAQCLLHEHRLYAAGLDGRFDRATARAVRRFQATIRSLEDTGVLTRRTWAALLSAGRHRLLKVGSGGEAVRRTQRALNALGPDLRVDGVFGIAEHRAVRSYARSVGQPRSGVMTPRLWRLLQRGAH